MKPTSSLLSALALAFALLGMPCGATEAVRPALPASGLPAFSEAMLTAEFWVQRAPSPDTVLLSPEEVAAQRQAAYGPGGGFVDLQPLPATVGGDQVAAWLKQAEQTPVKLAVDATGRPVDDATLRALRSNTAVDKIAPTVRTGHGLSVRRTALRALPSARPFFAAADQRDIESLTAGILFPGEPVVTVHRSADG